MNKVILIGNITRDIELRYTANGSAIAAFGLAANRNWTEKATGEKKSEAMFIDVSVFGRSAEVASQHLSKGSKILVEGRIKLDNWQDQQGQKKSKHSIVCESFEFLDQKNDTTHHQERDRQRPEPQNGYGMGTQKRNNDQSQNNGFYGQGDQDMDIPF